MISIWLKSKLCANILKIEEKKNRIECLYLAVRVYSKLSEERAREGMLNGLHDQ